MAILKGILPILALSTLIAMCVCAAQDSDEPQPASYSISGYVRTDSARGDGITGVTLTFKGAWKGAISSDGSGEYAQSGLEPGTYTVTPSKANWEFNPRSQTVTITDGPVSVPDFIGTPLYFETEPNNSYKQANWMDLDYVPPAVGGKRFTGVIEPADPSEDWYRFRTVQDGELSVTLFCTEVGLKERLHITIFKSNNPYLPSKMTEEILKAHETTVTAKTGSTGGGDYYVQIVLEGSCTHYNLTPSFK